MAPPPPPVCGFAPLPPPHWPPVAPVAAPLTAAPSLMPPPLHSCAGASPTSASPGGTLATRLSPEQAAVHAAVQAVLEKAGPHGIATEGVAALCAAQRDEHVGLAEVDDLDAAVAAALESLHSTYAIYRDEGGAWKNI